MVYLNNLFSINIFSLHRTNIHCTGPLKTINNNSYYFTHASFCVILEWWLSTKGWVTASFLKSSEYIIVSFLSPHRLHLTFSYVLLLLLLLSLSTPLRVFNTTISRWSLSDSKCRQVVRNFLSILANLNNAVVWMVSSRPLISKSISPCANPLATVLRAPTLTDITISFIFHRFFQFPSKVEILYFSFRFLSILLWGQPRQQSPLFSKFSIFFSNYY